MIVIFMSIVAATGILLAAANIAIGGPIFAAGLVGAAISSKFR